jgi:glycolate oxidase FAD binding subunit
LDTLKVRDADDVEQVVRAALASEQPLEIVGHGSKRLIGQPMATNALLDLSALNAVTAYEPNELIITVQAGAPLADVLSLIDSKNQQFAFEPMNTSMLLGAPDIGTIGGMIGAGLAGPRRIKAGGARDHLLGAHAVSGFGDSFKAGGRVVKNVTGYDLCKLLAGSWGTLAVMTEVTLKVMPRSESERTLVLRGLDDVTAVKAMTAALGSPFDVSGAAHLPNSAFRAAEGALAELGSQPVTLLRLEGGGASRCRAGQGSGAVRDGGNLARCGLGGGLECGSRRCAFCGGWCARSMAGVADRLSAGPWRRARSGAGARHRWRRDL